jgi:predicted GIY-YIG superfamily endonuclease
MYVYLLESSSKKTYIGATVNLDRRLSQHNKVRSGGAKYTGKWVDKGDTWKRVCYVSGFPTWIDALQFEWKWKNIARSLPLKSGIQKKLEALTLLLACEKSTSTSTPFDQWPSPPEVHEEKSE